MTEQEQVLCKSSVGQNSRFAYTSVAVIAIKKRSCEGCWLLWRPGFTRRPFCEISEVHSRSHQEVAFLPVPKECLLAQCPLEEDREDPLFFLDVDSRTHLVCGFSCSLPRSQRRIYPGAVKHAARECLPPAGRVLSACVHGVEFCAFADLSATFQRRLSDAPS